MKKEQAKLKKAATHYENVLHDDEYVGCGCQAEHLHPEMQEALKLIDPEILSAPFGSASPLPPDIDGCVVLDIGCGSGQTAFAASRLVGSKGKVIGLDMRKGLLATAEKNLTGHMKKFGYKKPNIQFLKGTPEELKTLGIKDNSVDVVVANEFINLSPDKRPVFSEIFRVLKPGGEFCFTTVLADRRLPASLTEDASLVRAGIAGAMYTEDFRRLLRDLGCHDYRNYTKQPLTICNPASAAKVALASFSFRTIRTFKLNLEDICEDFGQAAIYKGTIPGFPHAFPLDDHHFFVTGKPMLVCGNSGAMVDDTRFGKHFTVTGNKNIHYGPFDCS